MDDSFSFKAESMFRVRFKEGVPWGLGGRSMDIEARGFLFAGGVGGTSGKGLCQARTESKAHLCHQSVTSESQQAGLG